MTQTPNKNNPVGIKESVIRLIHAYMDNIVVTGLDVDNNEFNIFTEDKTNVQLRDEWGALNQKQANLVVMTVDDAVDKLTRYIEEANSVPKLKLVK